MVPSCIYNIRILNYLGYKVIAVLGSSTETLNKALSDNKIEYYIMDSAKGKKNSKILELAYNIKYFMYVRKILKSHYTEGDIAFIGTADTAMALGNLNKRLPSVICIKELYEDQKIYSLKLAKLCRKATAVVACEKNRARIMQSCWKLNRLPYYVANKPFSEEKAQLAKPTSKITKDVIEQIKGKKTILYQGYYIGYPRQLMNIAKALKQLNNGYILLLVGIITDKIEKQIKDIYPNVIATGHIPSPAHMEITGYANIGITVYSETKLNNLFCAPNKIYEYAMHGIPSLCNDLPGLIETIGISGAGVCVDINNIDSIVSAIQYIDDNMEAMRVKSIDFYNSVDTVSDLNRIVNDVVNHREQL